MQLFASETPSERINGAQIRVVIQAELAEYGLRVEPSIKPDRLFRTCDGDVVVEKAFGGWKTVRVICRQENAWDIYVRTGYQSEAPAKADKSPENLEKSDNLDLMQRVIVVRPVSRGDLLTREDLGLQTLSRSGSGGFTDIDELVGRRAKKSLRAGLVLHDRHLQPDWMVHAKQSVSVVNNTGGIQVTTAGIALENGRLGDLVKVRNLSSNSILHGFVAGTKKILIGTKIN
ncbi:MAG: flagellar basal body P-ring formation chaperone FlgA [Pseudomonadota bacterium]|nr:flagellar basal body P-ring formation chaperone FlgA [Pseudomonadota bacterium]MEC7234458.1 flagellar basal body P-ring formation chaperone FlgA [Pseudomonadota bacterium]